MKLQHLHILEDPSKVLKMTKTSTFSTDEAGRVQGWVHEEAEQSLPGQRWRKGMREAEFFWDKHLQWGARHDRKKPKSWYRGFAYNNLCNLPNQPSTRFSPKFLIEQVSGNQKCILGYEIFSLPTGTPWG